MDFMKVMHTRQTTRSFQTFGLSRGQIEIILQAGQNAPISRGRFEDYHITVIKNSEILAAITSAAKEVTGNADRDPLYGAPAFFVVSAKEPAKQGSIASAAAIVENMHLQATAELLGSCFVMGVIIDGTLNSEGIREKMGIPEGFTPVAGMVAGYPHGYLHDRPRTLEKIASNIVE
ncbi:nitroreductase family protein [Trichococcus collinsii]|uniref:Nitroreductase n=1 Tax=Trichococcus collinsii TaxID=157076 RepID=A0AB37ZZZ5_9LACT|nr:nitroreductase family protein [Trichococcus collinsii]CZQ88184.1 nitroreductase [Trichococcus collinsii]SEA44665.1 Nitroreductase [Trichococcus collinsii]